MQKPPKQRARKERAAAKVSLPAAPLKAKAKATKEGKVKIRANRKAKEMERKAKVAEKKAAVVLAEAGS